jgi:hypothetical protein
MAEWLFWGVVFTIANRLLPFPPVDDRIRAAWAWAWKKLFG